LDLSGLPNVGKGVLDAALHTRHTTRHTNRVGQPAVFRAIRRRGGRTGRDTTYVATSVGAFDQLHLALGVELERGVVELALLQEFSVMVGALVSHPMHPINNNNNNKPTRCTSASGIKRTWREARVPRR